jgi:hypothetical protein
VKKVAAVAALLYFAACGRAICHDAISKTRLAESLRVPFSEIVEIFEYDSITQSVICAHQSLKLISGNSGFGDDGAKKGCSHWFVSGLSRRFSPKIRLKEIAASFHVAADSFRSQSGALTAADEVNRPHNLSDIRRRLFAKFWLRLRTSHTYHRSLASHCCRDLVSCCDSARLESAGLQFQLSELLPQQLCLRFDGISLPFNLPELVMQIVRFPFRLGSKIGNVGDSLFDVRGIEGIYVAQDCYGQSAKSDQECKPLIKRQTAEKILGWLLVSCASSIGAVAAAFGVGSIEGRVFGLSPVTRIRFGTYCLGLLFVAVFILVQLGAPLLQP